MSYLSSIVATFVYSRTVSEMLALVYELLQMTKNNLLHPKITVEAAAHV